MGNNRDFSDSIKLEIIKSNLKKNNGTICCELCHDRLNTIEDCHFDHVYPFAKGGKSTLDNCQILCSDCNLRKNDKELQDFILEEKAKQFLAGTRIDSVSVDSNSDGELTTTEPITHTKEKKLSKQEFDDIISRFIERKGDIHKVDFTRVYNKLPSFNYVKEYYGNLNTMKIAFGIEDLSLNWTRENIKQTLLNYIKLHGDVNQKDLKKKNGLPSYPCIMKYYSEFKSFSQFKQDVLGMTNVYKRWTKEEAIEYGIAFMKEHGSLTEKDLKAKNRLPTSKVIYNFFGSMKNYQRAIGAPVMDSTEYISREDIEDAVDRYFENRDRVVESRKVFFESFPYNVGTIYKRYGSFDNFCESTGVTFLNAKKASYTKKEIDDAIHNWIFSGNEIPKAKDLTQFGLPSMSSIMKYYESWKEPFIIYKKIYDEANRNK